MTALRRRRRPTAPGAILRAHYMEPRGIRVVDLAEAVGVSRKHMSRIVNGHRRIEPQTAARLAVVLGTSARLWLNRQANVDEWDAAESLGAWQPSRVFAPPSAPAGA